MTAEQTRADTTPLPHRPHWQCSDGNAHQTSTRVSPGWWKCNECGVEWPGPNYG